MFDGYRVLELGTWVLVPAAATVLADVGADVVKIEHPRRGDPQRGLSTGGVTPDLDGVSIAVEQTKPPTSAARSAATPTRSPAATGPLTAAGSASPCWSRTAGGRICAATWAART
jgi:hypothetical protein